GRADMVIVLPQFLEELVAPTGAAQNVIAEVLQEFHLGGRIAAISRGSDETAGGAAAAGCGKLKQEGSGGGISTQCLRREAGTGRGEVGRGLVHADRHCPGFIGGAKGARVIDRTRRAVIDPRNGGVRDGDIASAGGGG